jgi:hypothetical protein
MFSFKLRKEALRHSRAFFSAAALLFVAPLAIHATSITYNLTLTETDGLGHNYDGTGQVTIDVSGTPQNGVNYTPTAMSFNIDGQTFNMDDPTAQGNDVITFSDVANGGVWDVTFSETNADGYRLVSTAGYIFYIPYNDPVSGADWTGTFSATPIAPTPEPNSMALLGTGLFVGAGAMYRRYKFHRS